MRLGWRRAQDFLGEDASGLARYLASPTGRGTLMLEGAPGPLTVLLAPSPEKRGGQATAYAAIAGRGPVALVEASALTEIGRSLNDLRDRSLVGGLQPKDVPRLQVKSGGKAILLDRKSTTGWRILHGGRGAGKTSHRGAP